MDRNKNILKNNKNNFHAGTSSFNVNDPLPPKNFLRTNAHGGCLSTLRDLWHRSHHVTSSSEQLHSIPSRDAKTSRACWRKLQKFNDKLIWLLLYICKRDAIL